MKYQECLLIGTGLWRVRWGVSVILVRLNLSIIPPVKHNFDHNTLVSRKHSTLFFEHDPADPRKPSGPLNGKRPSLSKRWGQQPPTPSLYRAALLQGRSFLHRSSVSDPVLCPAFHHLQLFPSPWQPSRPRVYLFRWYRTSPPPYN